MPPAETFRWPWTPAARDAIESPQVAITEAERLLGHPLVDDGVDAVTGKAAPLTIVSDNRPAFKSAEFVGFFARHPELRHVRTRHHRPRDQRGVERFNRSFKYEHLYREEIGDVIALRDEVEAYRELYNWVRPHETLGQLPPMARYLGGNPPIPLDPTYPSPRLSRELDAGQRSPPGRRPRTPSRRC